MTDVQAAIDAAERILPGEAAAPGEEDPRWLAIIKVSEILFTDEDPAPVWPFIERWGSLPDDDLSMAVAKCLLEHLLQKHFEVYFPKVASAAYANRWFADTVRACGSMAFRDQTANVERYNQLIRDLGENVAD